MIIEFSKRLQIDIELILGRSRNPEIVDARHMYWHLLKDAGYSYSMIGRLCGVDHTAVMHGVSRVDDMLSIGDKRVTDYYEQTKDLRNDNSSGL